MRTDRAGSFNSTTYRSDANSVQTALNSTTDDQTVSEQN